MYIGLFTQPETITRFRGGPLQLSLLASPLASLAHRVLSLSRYIDIGLKIDYSAA